MWYIDENPIENHVLKEIAEYKKRLSNKMNLINKDKYEFFHLLYDY